MAQLSDDFLAFGGALMRLDEIPAFLDARVSTVPGTATIPLADALGRVAARDVAATVSLPGFDNSAVDGYAVRHADLNPEGETRLPIAGYIRAGAGGGDTLAPASAVRIFTGAPMPAQSDTVFMQEDCRVEGTEVILPPGLKPGANRRLKGEDVAQGAAIILKGCRLRPQDVALAAAGGHSAITCVRRVRVALFSTGDEIFEPGTDLPAAGVYDANRPLLKALLLNLGAEVTDLGILADDLDSLTGALKAAAADHDLVLTSGGVSTGDADHVKTAVESLGRLDFWRLAIKPGRPVTMGLLPKDAGGNSTVFAGLPGNPVAAFVTFVFVIRPLIEKLSGQTPAPPAPTPVVSDFAYRKKPGRREFVRVCLTQDSDGRVLAHKFQKDGAGVLSSLTETDGLAVLTEDVTQLAPGDRIGFLPYQILMG